MKKRILSLLMALCLVLTLIPAALAAEGVDCTDNNCAHTVAIGGKHFDTLADAVDAAEDNATIQMIADETVTEPVVFPEEKTLTLDLNGCTIQNVEGYLSENEDTNIKYTANGTALWCYGVLTITDSQGTGLVRGYMYAKPDTERKQEQFVYAAYAYGANAKLTIQGGNFVANSEWKYFTTEDHKNAIAVIAEAGAWVYIEGGDLKGDGDAASIGTSGNIKITGGTLQGHYNSTLRMPAGSKGDLIIEGGVFRPANHYYIVRGSGAKTPQITGGLYVTNPEVTGGVTNQYSFKNLGDYQVVRISAAAADKVTPLYGIAPKDEVVAKTDNDPMVQGTYYTDLQLAAEVLSGIADKTYRLTILKDLELDEPLEFFNEIGLVMGEGASLTGTVKLNTVDNFVDNSAGGGDLQVELSDGQMRTVPAGGIATGYGVIGCGSDTESAIYTGGSIKIPNGGKVLPTDGSEPLEAPYGAQVTNGKNVVIYPEKEPVVTWSGLPEKIYVGDSFVLEAEVEINPDYAILGAYLGLSSSLVKTEQLSPTSFRVTALEAGAVKLGYRIASQYFSYIDFVIEEPTGPDPIPATASPVVDDSQIDEADREAVLKSAANVQDVSGELTEAALEQAKVVPAQQIAAAKDAYRSEIDSTATDENIKIYAQTYLAVTPIAYSVTEEEKFITLDITPMCRLVASTADAAKNITLEGENPNSVVLEGSEQKIDIQSMKMVVPIPDFKGSPIYVQHKGYEYTASTQNYLIRVPTVGLAWSAIFMNPHGFSEFTITTKSAAMAQVDGASYTTFQAAMNAAQDGQTVTILRDEDLTAAISGDSRTVQVYNGTQDEITVTVNGEEKAIAPDQSEAFTYTKPNTGGSGGSGSSSYAVSVGSADNGTVTASAKNASRGSTVTITVKPDDGYELDTLTVTDRNGNAQVLTNKGDGVYTFTMPASKVEIKASFIEIKPPITTPGFTDVPSNVYYTDAVTWAVENEITNGTGDGTTFSPDLGCTRAQVVTFLWRAAGCPTPTSSTSPFDDVLPGTYYYEAVLWAVEHGITVGTSPSTFSPDVVCSRAQIVTFLWRNEAQPDASTISSFVDIERDAYYADAVAWAVENGITVGTSPSTFSPNENCTRAQIVTFLYRYMA